jgi:ribonucleoside-diphosphate reductase alpha chain
MHVINRKGEKVEVEFDKITQRNKKLSKDLDIDTAYLSKLVINGLSSGMTTIQIDELAAETACSLITTNIDYDTLATRIVISNLHKNTKSTFWEVLHELRDIYDEDIYNFAIDNIKILEDTLDYSKDYNYGYFGFKTLEKTYLLRNTKTGTISERPQHLLMRVALGIHAKFQKSISKVIESYNEMSLGKFTHATPTLFNAATKYPALSSCFLLGMNDSVESMYECIKRSALISKHSGGIGINISNIRAKGSKIRSSGGTSEGIIPMIKVFNHTARHITQGGKRKGSIAIYIEPHHPEILEFLDLRLNNGKEELRARDIFTALWVPDLFMKKVEENGMWSLFCPEAIFKTYGKGLQDVYGKEFEDMYIDAENKKLYTQQIKAHDIWTRIINSQIETGLPYIMYKDSVNEKNNQKNIGIIRGSNLCVAPETLILTDKGHVTIQDMEGQKVNVWNGEEFSEVTVTKTGVDQDLINVFTDDGSKLSCTPYHKFYIQETYSDNSIKMVEAQTLKPGDKLIKCDFPVIDGPETFQHAYTHGFFCGDGTYGNISDTEEMACRFAALDGHYFCKRHLDFETHDYLCNHETNGAGRCQANSYCKKPMVYLYGEKKDLLPHLTYRSYTDNGGRLILQLPVEISEKFSVPSFNCSLSDKMVWFAGYCDADGTIARNGDIEQLQVGSINYEFLQHVKLMLQTCGINPKIRQSMDKGQNYLPDGKGGHKYFDIQPVYRLLITSCELYTLVNLGFAPKRLKIVGNKPSMDAKQFIKILKVENNNRCDDTYCFTEPKRHMGVFNGILTGQCSEIVQYTDDNSVSVCNLASIALPKFIDSKGSYNLSELGRITEMIVENLNNVIDNTFYPIPEAKITNLSHRPIGIGIQGLADVFAILKYSWDSLEALDLNKRIFETIYFHAVKKSSELAQIHGSYERFTGSPASFGILQYDMWNVKPITDYDWTGLKEMVKCGMRNSLLVAPMPTASTAQILGNNEAFEPFTSNIYSRKVISGDFTIVNKYLYNDLKVLGLWTKETINKIITEGGSIQSIDCIPENIKNLYKTVWEISQKTLIDMAVDRGAFIDQSQSLNLFIAKPTLSKLSSMHLYSWKKGSKNGIYYLRSKPATEAIKFSIIQEVSQKLEIKSEIKSEDSDQCISCGS